MPERWSWRNGATRCWRCSRRSPATFVASWPHCGSSPTSSARPTSPSTCARPARRIYGKRLDPRLRGIIQKMGDQARQLFQEATEAYLTADVARASAIADMDEYLDDLQREFVQAIFTSHAASDSICRWRCSSRSSPASTSASATMPSTSANVCATSSRGGRPSSKVLLATPSARRRATWNDMNVAVLGSAGGALGVTIGVIVGSPSVPPRRISCVAPADDPRPVVVPGNEAVPADATPQGTAPPPGPTWASVVDKLSLGVVVMSRDGAVRYRNKEAAKRSGTHVGLLLDDAVRNALRRALGGQESRRTLDLYGPPELAVVIAAEPLPDGSAVATIEDVSERRRVDAVRTDFVANISHELKTPVGALAVLADALSGESDPEVVQRVADADGRRGAPCHRHDRRPDGAVAHRARRVAAHRGGADRRHRRRSRRARPAARRGPWHRDRRARRAQRASRSGATAASWSPHSATWSRTP